MIGVQQYTGFSLLVLERHARGHTKLAISHQKVLANSAACRHSCLENNQPWLVIVFVEHL
jgi:hypothetical protein